MGRGRALRDDGQAVVQEGDHHSAEGSGRLLVAGDRRVGRPRPGPYAVAAVPPGAVEADPSHQRGRRSVRRRPPSAGLRQSVSPGRRQVRLGIEQRCRQQFDDHGNGVRPDSAEQVPRRGPRVPGLPARAERDQPVVRDRLRRTRQQQSTPPVLGEGTRSGAAVTRSGFACRRPQLRAAGSGCPAQPPGLRTGHLLRRRHRLVLDQRGRGELELRPRLADRLRRHSRPLAVANRLNGTRRRPARCWPVRWISPAGSTWIRTRRLPPG